jgi:chromosome segregation ATPase
LTDEELPALITEILQGKSASAEKRGPGPLAPALDPRKLHESRVDGKEPAEPARKQVSEIAGLLRQIEARFRDLQSDLTVARRRLHQNKAESRPAKAIHGTESGETDKLRAENAGLTETVRQLRSTMNELAERSFDEAISRKADTDSPMTDPTAQYKSLLTARLRQAIASFQAVNRENHPDALPLLLENIFQVLEENGLDLSGIETPPAAAKRKY